MSVLLAISPHLDDAVFSAGAQLARAAGEGRRVVVATCFTGNVERPGAFALACQLDKGLGPEVDYMALRRAEDAAACAALGAEWIHLPFLEAPHRGYDSAAALFGEPLPEAGLEAELQSSLGRLVEQLRSSRLLAPAAIGGHVDHRLVRRVVERLGLPVEWWADLPYAARAEAPPADFDPIPCGGELEAKRRGCSAYRSQLQFQFGGADVPDGLIAIEGAEWFSRSGAIDPQGY